MAYFPIFKQTWSLIVSKESCAMSQMQVYVLVIVQSLLSEFQRHQMYHERQLKSGQTAISLIFQEF